MNEVNHYSRNLKVISVFFILYWLLDLTPTGDDTIRLQLISYTIHNTALLPGCALLALLYFAWRFWVTKELRDKWKISYNLQLIEYFDINNTHIQKKADKLAKKHYQKYGNTNAIMAFKHNNLTPTGEYTLEPKAFTGETDPLKSIKLNYSVQYSSHNFTPTCYYRVTPIDFPHIYIRALIKHTVSTEEGLDHALPLLLLFCAVICFALIQYDIRPQDFLPLHDPQPPVTQEPPVSP